MTQNINLSAALGASKTGLSIGYRVLNMNGTTQIAFTTSNVVESNVDGTYIVTVPVAISDDGGRVIFGVSGTDYLEFAVDPANTAILAAIDALNVLPAAAAASGNVAGTLNIVRASTFETTLTGIVAPSGWSAAYFTVKLEGNVTSADSTSVMQIKVSNPGAGGDGLLYLNGAAGTASGASLVVNTNDDEADIFIKDDITAQLATGSYRYDIKFLYTGSKSGYIYVGTIQVSATPTQTYNAA